MKTGLWMAGTIVVSLLAQAGMAAPPSGAFKISSLKKTIDKDQSETQGLPRGSTSLEEKKVVYQFKIQNQSTDFSTQELRVRWIVMMEGAGGRSFQAGSGEKTTVLPFGRPVVLETAPLSLSERTWRGLAGRTVETGQVLEGYGLQILTQDGQLLMENYEPDSLKDDIQWQAASKPPAPVRGVRPINRPLRAPIR